MLAKKCVCCGNEFNKPSSCSVKSWETTKYCSRKCFSDDKNIELECIYCHKKFIVNKCHKDRKLCSDSCSNKWKGEDNNIGFKKGHPQYGENNYWKGKTFTDEHKKHIGEGNKGKKLSEEDKKKISGKNHWNWKGGITSENNQARHNDEYINWRNAVYVRDWFTCQICKVKCNSKSIIAHHIKPFSDYKELRYNVDNGVCLCRSCHKKTHKEIGLNTQYKKQ